MNMRYTAFGVDTARPAYPPTAPERDAQRPAEVMTPDERRIEDYKTMWAAVSAERDELLKLAYIGDHHSPENTYKFRLDELVPQHRAAQRRLSEIIGYCGQEGHDGEPWDTINAIATGDFSTRGGGA